jgi:hypothetical protein
MLPFSGQNRKDFPATARFGGVSPSRYPGRRSAAHVAAIAAMVHTRRRGQPRDPLVTFAFRRFLQDRLSHTFPFSKEEGR